MTPTRHRGFSLLELLVVLFLMGLVYAVAGPMLNAGATGLDMKSAARQVAAGLRKARSIAVAEHREAFLTLDVDSRKFQISGDQRIYDLPQKIDFALFTAQSEVMEGKIGSIRFFPDGSSTGGRVTISAGESRQLVDVDWLTGRVKVL